MCNSAMCEPWGRGWAGDNAHYLFLQMGSQPPGGFINKEWITNGTVCCSVCCAVCCAICCGNCPTGIGRTTQCQGTTLRFQYLGFNLLWYLYIYSLLPVIYTWISLLGGVRFMWYEKFSHFTRAVNCSGGSVLDCRSTDWAIDPEPGAWFIPKYISFARIVLGPV